MRGKNTHSVTLRGEDPVVTHRNEFSLGGLWWLRLSGRATRPPSLCTTIRCLEADIVPTAISAEMGGAGAVDQPEVVGLVILSAPQRTAIGICKGRPS